MKQLNPFTVPICFLSQQRIDVFHYLGQHKYATMESLMDHAGYQKPFISSILLDLSTNGFANYNRIGKTKDYYLTPLGLKLHTIFIQLESQGTSILDFFSVASNINRMQMVKYIYIHPSATITELAYLASITQAAASIFVRKCEAVGMIYRDDKKSNIGFYAAEKYMPLLRFLFF